MLITDPHLPDPGQLGAQEGPRLSWRELTHAQQCQGSACDPFKSRVPSTVAMTVLVVVEMFNALNALSENASLLQLPPWSNRCALSSFECVKHL